MKRQISAITRRSFGFVMGLCGVLALGLIGCESEVPMPPAEDGPVAVTTPNQGDGIQTQALPSNAIVCFYEDIDYKAARLCYTAGATWTGTFENNWIGTAWNDRVSSVQLRPGAQLELYSDINRGGRTLKINSDTPTLVVSNFNDLMSSFRLTRTPSSSQSDLAEPRNKDIAMQLVSSAENSSLDWRAQFRYIEDIGDGRGYTAGIIGFCSGTGDMLELVQEYTRRSLGNVLAKYLPALRNVNGSDSHSGLDPNFVGDWRRAAADQVFQAAQESERDRVYFNPAVQQAKTDGLRALGQFIYYDAIVMHGPGNDSVSFGGIRNTALSRAKPPSQGGDEAAYLHAFLDARVAAMKTEAAHSDTSRVDTAQRVFLNAGNLDLKTPLNWKVYGDSFTIN